jgi:hypothetical protein
MEGKNERIDEFFGWKMMARYRKIAGCRSMQDSDNRATKMITA